MGTRHLIAVKSEGEYKIAQYGQWDGYPSGQGVRVLKFLSSHGMEDFKVTLRSVSFLTEEDWDDIITNHTDEGRIEWGSEHEEYWDKNLFHLKRDCGADILGLVARGEVNKLKDSLGFAGDSLFCEYAYIVDLDEGVFEVYEGFNEEPITEGRFLSSDESLERSDGYHPVKLKKIYSLDKLPSEEVFLEELETEEDE